MVLIGFGKMGDNFQLEWWNRHDRRASAPASSPYPFMLVSVVKF